MKTKSIIRWSLAAAVASLAAPALDGQGGVVNSPHNLSASGPGTVRAASDQRICVFCHAPHNTSGATPLWNRSDPVSNYTIYTSSTLDALPGQPTGVSKKCLSCHDGTIALGAVVSEATAILMSGSQTLTGTANLGTDLSDDHPIALQYTSGLAAADPQLRDPASLPPTIKLDGGGEIQCTSCHDAHDNSLGRFLVVTDQNGDLCTSCHQMNGWTLTPHRTSTAAMPATGNWPYASVAQNACQSCHSPHSAGDPARLLRLPQEEQNCLVCHDGQTAGFNILSEINKFSSHDPRSFQGVHDPVETGGGTQTHVECADCHNPHAVQPPTFSGGFTPIGNTLLETRGITQGGAPITQAQFEYEVCFRCHGDNPVNIAGRITRLADSANLRLDFSTSNPSFHPVAGAGVNPDVPSLRAGWTTSSRVRCTDCHNNDQTRRTGGTGPDGPHGSIYDFLLEKNYTTTDPNAESNFSYALCYKCHDRSSILNDDSFKEHDKHIRGEDASCSVCHDPHGIGQITVPASDYTHLINFDLSVVSPSPSTGTIEFQDNGRFRGSCTLLCHGKNHQNKSY